MAEELRFDQRLRQGRAVDPDERHLALAAPVVDGARHELLARAGFADDQDGAARLRDDARRPNDLLNRPAPADDAVVIELLVALGDEVVVVRAQAPQLDRALRDDEKFVDFEGLLQVVQRAELHRFDRALHGRMCRHHEDLGALGGTGRIDDLPDQLEAAQLGHQVVHDEQIERPLANQPQRLAWTACRIDVVPFVAKGLGQSLSNFRFVVDEKYRSACQRLGSLMARSGS